MIRTMSTGEVQKRTVLGPGVAEAACARPMTLDASGAALATSAKAPAVVDEKDAQAAALGDAADAKRVDVKKYPNRRQPELQQLRVLPGQGQRQGERLPAVCRQAGGGRGLVQRLGEEGLNALAVGRGS
jgi:hypothetical protein